MLTKAKIYNIALGALLLNRRVSDPETDQSNECKVLNTHWDVAFAATLEDLDLDSTSIQADLELVQEDPNELWDYAYKYPQKCAYFRRIQSVSVTDNRHTHIPRRIAMLDDQKVILTNEVDAIAEFISTDISPTDLYISAAMAIAYRLAILSAPLIVGKGAKSLIERLETQYIAYKAEAQERDQNENFSYVDEALESEFVAARTT